MRALWRRRAFRHVIVGLLPLLVVGPVAIIVLAVRFADTAQPVREATARATAVVQRSGLGADRRDIELRWTDAAGVPRTSTVRAARADEVRAGTEVELRYHPDDPGRVFVGGDETSERLRDLAFGMVFTGLLVAAVLVVSAVHVVRRLAAERRPGRPSPASYARSRLGIVRRAWLRIEDQGVRWWVPVHWEPELADLPDGTRVAVHGTPSQDRVVVADVAGTAVWQAGRRRQQPPRGEITEGEDLVRTTEAPTAGAGRRTAPDRGPEAGRGTARAGDTAAPGGSETVPLGRHFRSDSGLLAAAPLMGLLWAYVDGSGRGGWLVATVLMAAVLFWLPTVAASDPT